MDSTIPENKIDIVNILVDNCFEENAWRRLAEALNLQASEIYRIERLHRANEYDTHSTFNSILRAWHEVTGRNATFRVLITTMEGIRLKKGAEKIGELVEKISNAPAPPCGIVEIAGSSSQPRGDSAYLNKEVPSDGTSLNKISSILGATEYTMRARESFFLALGVQNIWEDNERRTPQVSYYNALHAWINRNSRDATFGKLNEVLLSLEWKLIADKIKQIEFN